jgi:hypothetical protein
MNRREGTPLPPVITYYYGNNFIISVAHTESVLPPPVFSSFSLVSVATWILRDSAVILREVVGRGE